MSNAHEALKVLTKIWGRREGYVFLPWIEGTATRETRKSKYHEGRAFEWPKEKAAILTHMEKHRDDDLYFCPNLFLMKRRVTNVAAEEKALWADLDEVNPESLDNDLRPTIAWESSPGRYQAIWLLTEEAVLASEVGGLGQRLTYHIGADLGGWDSTQLLRPPGWKNHKPDYREQYGKAPQGKLLWGVGPRYTPAELDEALPHLEAALGDSLSDTLDHEIGQIDRAKVIARIRLKLDTNTKRLLRAQDTGDKDRSSTLFYLERSLAEAGCTLAEIVAIVKETVWNKFDGRNDELKRLQIEASKAIEETRRKKKKDKEDDEGAFELVEDENVGPAVNLYSLVVNAPAPRWLVKDIWTQGGVGFISGSPKTYKSFFSLDMALSVSTGLPFLDKFPVNSPGPVLYIQEEDTLPTLKQRLGQVGGGKDPALHPLGELKLKDGKVFWGPGKVPDIDAWVMKQAVISDYEWQERIAQQLETKPYRMMILDPQMMLMGEIQENSYGEMTEHFFKPLKQIANTYKVAIVLIHHVTKSEGERGKGRRGARMLGSQAGFAWAQDSLHLDKANDFTSKIEVFRESKTAGNERYTVHVNFEGGKKIGQGLWMPEVSQTEQSGISGEPRVTKTKKRLGDALNATHKALQEMGAGTFSAQVIGDQSGLAVGSTRAQLSKLKKQGLVDGDGKGNWSLIEN